MADDTQAIDNDQPAVYLIQLLGVGQLASLGQKQFSINEWTNPERFSSVVAKLFNLSEDTPLTFCYFAEAASCNINNSAAAQQQVGVDFVDIIRSVQAWLQGGKKRFAFQGNVIGVDSPQLLSIVGVVSATVTESKRKRKAKRKPASDQPEEANTTSDGEALSRKGGNGKSDHLPWMDTCDEYIIKWHPRYTLMSPSVLLAVIC